MRPQSRIARFLLVAGACAALAAATDRPAWSQRHNTVSFEEGEEGWYPLFDGKGPRRLDRAGRRRLAGTRR